jgi:hypothetical protein
MLTNVSTRLQTFNYRLFSWFLLSWKEEQEREQASPACFKRELAVYLQEMHKFNTK